MMKRKPIHFLALAGAIGMAFSAYQEARAEGGKTTHVELKGAVSEVSGTCPALEFKIADQRITTHAGTQFEDGSCQEVTNGKQVEIKGQMGEDKKVMAREVDVD